MALDHHAVWVLTNSRWLSPETLVVMLQCQVNRIQQPRAFHRLARGIMQLEVVHCRTLVLMLQAQRRYSQHLLLIR